MGKKDSYFKQAIGIIVDSCRLYRRSFSGDLEDMSESSSDSEEEEESQERRQVRLKLASCFNVKNVGTEKVVHFPI